MKINRLRVAAISAAMTLSIAGAGVASAATPVVESTGIEAGTAETGGTGIEAEGVGGHEDAPGQNVDHQFDGQE